MVHFNRLLVSAEDFASPVDVFFDSHEGGENGAGMKGPILLRNKARAAIEATSSDSTSSDGSETSGGC